MLSQEIQSQLAGPLRTMRIIVLAMMASLVFFLGIVLFQRAGAANNPIAGVPVLTYVGVGFAAFATVARFVGTNVMVATARKNIASGQCRIESGRVDEHASTREFLEETGDAGRLCLVYQTRLIIGAAPLEGAGFFTIASFFVEGQILSLVISALVIIGVVSSFPTSSGLAHWIEEQLQLIEDDRRQLS